MRFRPFRLFYGLFLFTLILLIAVSAAAQTATPGSHDYARRLRDMNSLRLDAAVSRVAAGNDASVILRIFNKSDESRDVRVDFSSTAPEGFLEFPSVIRRRIEPGGEYMEEITVRIKASIRPGTYVIKAESVSADEKRPLFGLASARLTILEPAEIRITGRQDGEALIMETRVFNRSDSPIQGELSWRFEPRGRVRLQPVPFKLKQGDLVTTTCRMMPGNRSVRLVAEASMKDGSRAESDIGLVPVSFRKVPPIMDGSISEWADVPAVELDEPGLLAERESAFKWSRKDLAGRMKLWVTGDALFFAAAVTDDRLILKDEKPPTGAYDETELFLSVNGPSKLMEYTRGDFHLILSPAPEGEEGAVWDQRKKRKVPGSRLLLKSGETGYSFETEIPLRELNWEPERRRMIGFDAALNDVDEPGGAVEHRFIWSGKKNARDDPSLWGLAVLY